MSIDFVILKMKEDMWSPIIPEGAILSDMGDDHIKLNLFKASKFPSISNECHRIYVIDCLLRKLLVNMILMTLLSIVN